MNAADGFAITMLGMILLTLGMVVGMLLFMILKRPQGEDREIQQLLDEATAMAEQDDDDADPFDPPSAVPGNDSFGSAPDSPNGAQPDPQSPWEKEPDWWKS